MLCLKSGARPEGAKAVSSHTGSLAGSDSVYDALLIQAGVQRVDTIAELFDYAALYTTQPLPTGDRVAIITQRRRAGHHGHDARRAHGLKLAELSEATKQKLKPSLPVTASLRNPIDVIGDARARPLHRPPCAPCWKTKTSIWASSSLRQSMTDIGGDGRRRARGRQRHQQAGGLLVHGREGRSGGREDSPRGGHSEGAFPKTA